MPMGIGDTHKYSNILHVGLGGNKAHYGDRTPIIWFKPNTTIMQINCDINGRDYKLIVTDPKPINEWTRVEMSQLRQMDGVYQLTVQIAEVIVTQINNTDARDFSDVKVYTGDSFHTAANAKIANLTIDTFPDNINTVPTLTTLNLMTTTPITTTLATGDLLTII